MAQRFRLFVKKRGTRRTGTRWLGSIGEAVVYAILLAIGAIGLYWIIGSVLMDDSRPHGWWPWLVMVIPSSLVAVGISGLVSLLWQSSASSERRMAVAKKAGDWELLGEAARPTPPAVPPINAVVDSPGVRLAYRLPIDSAPRLLSGAMASICLAWNTLVAIFVYQVIQQHASGEPNWLLTWLLVPFVLAGVWTLVMLVRQVLRTTGIGTTWLEVSDHPLYPGQTYEAFVSQSGRLFVRWYQVQLVCEEQATFQQGTDTRLATATVSRETVYSQRRFEIPPGHAFEATFSFTVPESAMHSFASQHNAISWSLVVRGRMARWTDFERRFPVYVYPAAAEVRVTRPAPAQVEEIST